MKTIFSYTLSFCFLFLFACTEKNEINPLLVETESLLADNPDSALYVLKNIHFKKTDQYNLAYYYLLLIEAREINEESLLSCNLLLDWMLECIDDKDLIAKAMIYKGKVCMELNQLEETVLWYQKAIDILEETGHNYKILSSAYIELGKIFMSQSLYNEAMEISQKSYLLNDKKLNKKFAALSLRNIGWVHFYINNQDSIYHYFQEALVCAKQDKDSLCLTELIYNDLASYYGEVGDYEKALQQLQNITQIKDNTHLNMGSMYLNLQQYDSARHYLLLGSESDYIYTRVASYVYLEELENLLGDYKKAYYYSNIYSDLKDSIDLRERTFEIKAIDVKYNIKTTVNNLKEQYKTINQIIIFSSLFVLILILSVFSIREKKKKLKEKIQRRELLQKEEELLQKEKELIALNEKKIIQENLAEYEESRIKFASYQNLIQKSESDLVILLNQITNIQCEILRKTNIFSHVIKLNSQKKDKKVGTILNNDEQDTLKKEIFITFETFIESLRKNCTSLTEDDLLLCCLSLLKLPNLTIGMCFGSSDANKIKQRKFRIKEKMNNSNYSFLFNFIFPSPKQARIITPKDATN